MNPPLTPPMPEHLPGEEIPAKHKEAMRQLFEFAKNWPNATPRVFIPSFADNLPFSALAFLARENAIVQ